MKTRLIPFAFLLVAALAPAAAQDALSIGPGDIRVEQRDDGGYHLFVRARAGLGSVLLTETTRDPSGKAANYAYRAEAWNPVNGDERRKLDGAFISPASKLWSLIDSTPEADAAFGSAFHVFIPWVAAWGYPWTRNGREFIADGTFINIRAFRLPYGDYAGGYRDNPFTLSVVQRPFARAEPPAAPPAPAETPPAAPPPPDLSAYMPDTVQSFSSIAGTTGGVAEYSAGPDDILDIIARMIDGVKGDELELVLCIDTTDSMSDDIGAIKSGIPAMLREHLARFRVFRLGLVLYKDYFEEYVVKRSDFTADIASFDQAVQAIKVMGGRDIPEAVYEALYEALTGYTWSARERLIILIGDAPPHPIPRGRVDKSMTMSKAVELGVNMNVIVLPH